MPPLDHGVRLLAPLEQSISAHGHYDAHRSSVLTSSVTRSLAPDPATRLAAIPRTSAEGYSPAGARMWASMPSVAPVTSSEFAGARPAKNDHGLAAAVGHGQDVGQRLGRVPGGR